VYIAAYGVPKGGGIIGCKDVERGFRFSIVYKTSLHRDFRNQIPEDPTYTAVVDDLEPLVGKNMLVEGHQGHSMPVGFTVIA
jgi:hypothetical protein